MSQDGLHMNYHVIGDGEPLVLINPAFADLRIWDRVVEELSKEYKVVRFDSRYSGKTEQDGEDYSLYNDLNNLLEFLGLDKVNMIGVSAGGHTALEYVVQFPNKVKKVMLISTGLFGLKESQEKLKRLKKFREYLYSGNIDEAADTWQKMWLVGEKREEFLKMRMPW